MLPGMHYTLLGDQTVSSGATVTFAAIPSTFDDLYLHMPYARDDAAGSGIIELRFNNDTTDNNYWRQMARTYGTTVEGGKTNSAQTLRTGGSTGIGPCIGQVWIPNYATAEYKIAQAHYTLPGLTAFPNTGNLLITDTSILWNSTAAITEIDLTLTSGAYAAARFLLYGVSYSRP